MIHICIIARMIIMPQTIVYGFFVHYNTFVVDHDRSYLLLSDLTEEYNSTTIRVNHFCIVSLLSYSIQAILVTFFDHFRAETTIATSYLPVNAIRPVSTRSHAIYAPPYAIRRHGLNNPPSIPFSLSYPIS